MSALLGLDDLEPFWLRLADAPTRALLLDYDGTLAPFVVDRDRAVPYPGVAERVAAILDGGGSRLAVVTGRSAADLPRLLDVGRPFEIWGAHGLEHDRGDGTVDRPALPEAIGRCLDAVETWAAAEGLSARCERKAAGLAFHVRGLGPDAADRMRARAEERLRALAAGTGLELHPFDGGLELRWPGRDKGDAVRAMREDCGPGAAIAYLGDDRTDEDAFRALAEPGSAAGVSAPRLAVLVRADARPTAARAWLRPPEQLLAFLDRWHEVTRT